MGGTRMRKVFSGKVRMLIILALLFSIILAVAGNAMGINFAGMAVKGLLKPLRSGAQALTNQAEDIYSYMFRYESLLAENEQLKERIAQMEDSAREADAQRRENEYLRQLTGLQKSREDFKGVDAYVIAWGSNDWNSSLTINKGKTSGIREGMCATTFNGQVVGLVVEAGDNYAVIKSVLDSSLEISATVASSGYNGMVQGGYATGANGMLRMNYLPSDSVIRNNDQVVTAGSTVYPRNLILGYVVDADFDETGVAKYAVLEPAADFSSLEQVLVLTEYNADNADSADDADDAANTESTAETAGTTVATEPTGTIAVDISNDAE